MSPVRDDTAARRRGVTGERFREIGDAWERFTGQASGGANGRWRALVCPSDLSRVEADWAAAQRSGRFSSEYRARAKDGNFHLIFFYAERRLSHWYGYIKVVDRDHEHICTASPCLCGLEKRPLG
jgi:PAS domain-containing protein